MVKKVEFPNWEGYKDLENMKQLVSIGCYNDPKQILEYAAKMAIERQYFKELLLFVQYRVKKYIEDEEGLNLGLDSSKEFFEDLILVPAENVSFPGPEKEDEKKEGGEDNYEKFVRDMERAGIEYEEYKGRFFYHGPAVRTNEKGFPTRQDVIRATKIRLQCDNLGLDFIVYPANP